MRRAFALQDDNLTPKRPPVSFAAQTPTAAAVYLELKRNRQLAWQQPNYHANLPALELSPAFLSHCQKYISAKWLGKALSMPASPTGAGAGVGKADYTMNGLVEAAQGVEWVRKLRSGREGEGRAAAPPSGLYVLVTRKVSPENRTGQATHG